MVFDIYEGDIYRPPSEAYSLILQATVGCSWNRCTFCIAFQGKEFRAKTLEELKRDVEVVFPYQKNATRIFLADGNALCLPTDELEGMLRFLYSKFPRLERVTIYGGPLDIRKKTVRELARLRKAGLDMVYFGLESGSDEVLKRVKKGAKASTMIETGRKVREAGLKLSVIYILGLGGRELTEGHARETARVISAQDPQYAAALTLMVEPGSAIEEDVRSGRLTLLDPEEALAELHAVVEGLKVTDCVFRANHASNYVTFGGTLPGDREAILAQIDGAMEMGKYKPGHLRRL
jgi:radical SAM superfamily enzyme YgiQ (UPF0313 family)